MTTAAASWLETSDRKDPQVTVDVWMQHPTQRFIAEPMFEPLRRWTRGAIPDEGLPVASTLAAMDAAGVQRGLICAWHGPQGDLISNDDVAEVRRQAPDRFLAVASVDITHPVAAVEELRRRVEDDGFVALRVVPWLWGLPPNHRYYYPLLAECVRLGIPFMTQVGHTGPLRTSETGRPVPYLDDVALDFPDLVIVAGHIGYPWTSEMVALATKYPNVYIDTSAYVAHRFPPELVAYMKGNGHGKVLFGSNFPMLLPGQALARLDELGLPESVRADFLAGNATRIFGAAPGQDT
jgi:predicted TIM-barrel fold metal-dependent hydrolase